MSLDSINRKYRTTSEDCKCQCLPHLASFREDLNICVDDIHGELHICSKQQHFELQFLMRLKCKQCHRRKQNQIMAAAANENQFSLEIDKHDFHKVKMKPLSCFASWTKSKRDGKKQQSKQYGWKCLYKIRYRAGCTRHSSKITSWLREFEASVLLKVYFPFSKWI